MVWAGHCYNAYRNFTRVSYVTEVHNKHGVFNSHSARTV